MVVDIESSRALEIEALCFGKSDLCIQAAIAATEALSVGYFISCSFENLASQAS